MPSVVSSMETEGVLSVDVLNYLMMHSVFSLTVKGFKVIQFLKHESFETLSES